MLTQHLHPRFWRGAGHDIPIHGRHSHVYDRVARRAMRWFYRRLAADVAPVPPAGGTVLDVGTGPGLLLVELARQRPDLRLSGIDLSDDMVALAGANLRREGLDGRVEVRQSDVAALPYPDASFDLVVSSFSLHHWGEVAPAVRELARVLRPGGTLRIYDLRSVPGGPLTAAVVETKELGGQVPRRTLPKLGRLPLRLVACWTLTRPAPADG